MKKYAVFLIAFILIFPYVSIRAEEVSLKAVSFVPTKAEFDGTALKLSNDPLLGVIISEGETETLTHYMSLTGVLEQIGYIVNSDTSRNIISIVTAGSDGPEYVPSISSISMQAGAVRGAAFNNHTVTVNGTELDLGDERVLSVLRGTEAHPQFFIPIRTVLEALGFAIEQDGENGKIIISEEFQP